MDISLIICTWNSKKLLETTLEILNKCHLPVNLSWECIIVNNNSTDDTEKVILSFQDKLPIKYIFEPAQGLSRARNAGLKASTGKLIVFGDDDIEPCQEWLKAYWQAYQENPSGYYWGGPIESKYEKGELAADLIAVAPASVKGFNLGNKRILLGKDTFFIGPNWACPAKIIKELGGFDIARGLDPSSGKIKTGEETDLMMRLNESGWQGCYIPEAHVKHFVPIRKMTLKHAVSRWEAWGEAQAKLYEQHYLKQALVCGLPRRTVKEAFIKWMNYVIKRISGQKWYEAYVHYIEYVGILKGLKEIERAKRR